MSYGDNVRDCPTHLQGEYKGTQKISSKTCHEELAERTGTETPSQPPKVLTLPKPWDARLPSYRTIGHVLLFFKESSLQNLIMEAQEAHPLSFRHSGYNLNNFPLVRYLYIYLHLWLQRLWYYFVLHLFLFLAQYWFLLFPKSPDIPWDPYQTYFLRAVYNPPSSRSVGV